MSKMQKQMEVQDDLLAIKDTSVIPQGMYCHGGIHSTPDSRQPMGVRLETPHMCPYWSKRADRPEQDNGYCSFMEAGDGDVHPRGCKNALGEPVKLFLLWDQVKECGVNDDEDCDENEF